MGGSSSKIVRNASKAGRVYPTKPSTAVRAQNQPLPAEPAIEHTKLEARDDGTAADLQTELTHPNFANRLQSLGIVSPNPFFPPSQQPPQSGATPSLPSNSPILSMLRNREAQYQAHDAELERQSHGDLGTQFLSADKIQQVLRMRNSGVDDSAVEKQLNLNPGVLRKLGRAGIVDVV